jgi:hypothetical protein
MKLAGKGHEFGWARANKVSSDLAVDRLGRDKDFLQRTQGLSLSKQVTRLYKSAFPQLAPPKGQHLLEVASC